MACRNSASASAYAPRANSPATARNDSSVLGLQSGKVKDVRRFGLRLLGPLGEHDYQ